MQITQTSF